MEKMPFYGIGNVYFIQKIAELMNARYEVSEYILGTMRFQKRLLKNAELLRNYMRMS